MSDVAERVKKIVVEHLGVEADKVTENPSSTTRHDSWTRSSPYGLRRSSAARSPTMRPSTSRRHDAVKFEKNASAA
jgi:hypothetical protein